MSAWLSDTWAALTWRGWPPVVTRGRVDQAQAAFRLGVDVGAGGLVAPSQVSSVRHLRGLPSGVVGVEIPPR